MNCLSPELLLEIFDLVVHSEDDLYPGFPTREPDQTDKKPARYFVKKDEYPDFVSGIAAHETSTASPIHLSHVCQHWREVAFSHSKLWSTIYVTDAQTGYPSLLKTWLENSGEQPLKVVFRDGGEPTANISEEEEEFGEEEDEDEGYDEEDAEGSEEGKVVLEMLTLVARHRRRWETFKLKLQRIRLESDPVSEILYTYPEVDENLRSFALDFEFPKTKSDYLFNEWLSEYGSLMKRFLSASPRLNEVQMWDYVDPGLAEAIQYDKLTTLALHKVEIRTHYERFTEDLPKLVALRTFSLSLSKDQHRQSPASKSHTIKLPALQHLTIVGHCNMCLNNVLSQFHLPSLTDLSIHTDSLTSPTMELKLQALLDQWKPRLRRLLLRDGKASDFEPRYCAILSHIALQDVVELRLGGLVTEKLIGALTCQQPSAVALLPHLRQIHFEWVHTSSTVGRCPLTQLVLSRLAHQTTARLGAVKVGFQMTDDLETEKAFWDAQEVNNPLLRSVDRRFSWMGTGPLELHREFMVNDFSLIQGWAEQERGFL